MMAWRLGLGLGLALTVLGCGHSLPLPALTSAAQTGIFAKAPQAPAMDVQNFNKVHEWLYRGGYPDENALKVAVQLGIKTVISLQGKAPFEAVMVAQEKANAAKLGITWINVPLPFKVEPPKAMIDQVLNTLANKQSQPCYLHCYHGRDRTGTLAAVYRIKYDGLTNDQAFTEMKGFGFDPQKYPEFASYVQHYRP
ncbi:MAG: dual specificity protein phosphatase family protein [Candidatus Sericytochromatia bacterium]|nr:dual specificity protein phosphatase family protein [Candidatus Sericytochromatia bacterium]